jgi:hypothetical protein
MSDQTPDETPDQTPARRLHTTEVVAQENAAQSADAEESLVEILEGAQRALKASTDLAADRLESLWNPDARKYEPREEADTLHDIINENVRATLRLRRALRAAQRS